VKKHIPELFLILAMGFSWPLWILAEWLGNAYEFILPSFDYFARFRAYEFENNLQVFATAIFYFGLLGPMIAGWLTSYIAGGKKGVTAWFAPVLRWKIHPGWYVLMLVFTFTVFIAPLLIGWPLGQVESLASPSPVSGLLTGFWFVGLLFSALGQELGWRGFLLPRWTNKYGRPKALWYTGLAWFLWFSQLYMATMWYGTSVMEESDRVGLTCMYLIYQLVYLLGLNYIFTLLLDRTGSLCLITIFHFITIVVGYIISTYFSLSVSLQLWMCAPSWVIVTILAVIEKVRSERLKHMLHSE
jgi:uncharacterized protein